MGCGPPELERPGATHEDLPQRIPRAAGHAVRTPGGRPGHNAWLLRRNLAVRADSQRPLLGLRESLLTFDETSDVGGLPDVLENVG